MSNGSPPPASSFLPSPGGRRRGRLLAVALAVLVVVCGGAGWLLWGSGDHTDNAADGRRAPRAGAHTGPAAPHSSGTPGGAGPTADRPLAGRVVVLDPGHNPTNRDHTAAIARQVAVGNGTKECDTTGTATDAGYPEASFTLDVSHRVRALLRARGARVILTQDGDRAYGPCVDERARIGNRARADAVVSVHADGAAAGQHGFHVIAPAVVRGAGTDNSAITGPSRRLADGLISRFQKATGSVRSTYLGGGTGLTVRDDLGGLNLSTVPKVFIECGNMRDAADAARLTDPAWRQRAATGIAEGITDFLLD